MKTRTLKPTQKTVPKPEIVNPAQTLGEIFSKLSVKERETIEKIMVSLLTKDENLGMKTDLDAPMPITQLGVMSLWAEIENCPKTQRVHKFFDSFYKENRVSYNRKSREEITNALQALKVNERSLTEKLSEPPT